MNQSFLTEKRSSKKIYDFYPVSPENVSITEKRVELPKFCRVCCGGGGFLCVYLASIAPPFESARREKWS